MRPIRLLTLALVIIVGLGYPAGAMNARGERILIFGDSLTQHASGANPIWNVDAGPQRQSSGPGDLLASLLFDQGAAVRTNALVSRSAFNFWTREDAQTLIAADLAWKPTKIVFVLGTNDVGLAAAPDEAAFVRLRDAYKPAKAEIWAIGPFTSKLPAAGVAQVAETMRKVFGARFIDGRLLSAMISPGPDGVHYTPTSARLLALNLADALLSASPVKPWVGAAIGAAVVVGAGLVYGLVQNRRAGLAGLEIVNGRRWEGSTNELIRSGYKPTPCKSGLDAKGLARCWSRGLGDGLGIAPHEREALARAILDYKEVAQRRGYGDPARAIGACDVATPEFIRRASAEGVTLKPYRFDLTRAADLKRLGKLYNLSPKALAEIRRETAAKDADLACMFHEVAVTDDGLVIDWTANQFASLPMPFVFRLNQR